MCHVAEKPAGGVSPPVLFNPLHGEIDNIPLIHLPDGGVAKLNGGDGIRLLKILADFIRNLRRLRTAFHMPSRLVCRFQVRRCVLYRCASRDILHAHLLSAGMCFCRIFHDCVGIMIVPVFPTTSIKASVTVCAPPPIYH